MKAMTKWLPGAATAGAMLAAAPASAQYYDYDYRYRDRDTVDAVVDGVARVAGAVAAATQGYYDPRYGYYGNRYGSYGNRYGYGYNQGDRLAAGACAYEAQRRLGRRYGGVGVNIVSVRPYRYDRLRVTGTADVGGYYGYGRGRIGIACTVRYDGRVTDFDSSRRYAYGYRY